MINEHFKENDFFPVSIQNKIQPNVAVFINDCMRTEDQISSIFFWEKERLTTPVTDF